MNDRNQKQARYGMEDGEIAGHRLSMMRAATVLATAMLFLVGMHSDLWADVRAEDEPAKDEITEEELLFLEVPVVVTAAREEQPLSEVAAAAYVITQEDIRRSGMSTIPELLRMVPGMDVARINASTWAVSSRGFNDTNANMLLVMIDGRSVYSPLFAGVNWDVQDLMLEDVERIEVVRGPGGTLWGANAVNGVINVITKDAKDTRGGLVAAGTGSVEKWDGGARYGGKLGDSAYYRFYAKGFVRDGFKTASGADAHDAWDGARGGLRLEWSPTADDAVMLDANIYSGESDRRASITSLTSSQLMEADATANLSGGHALLRWRRRLSAESDLTLQGYFDRAEREDINLGQRINTYDLDFQHRFPWGGRQEIIWGLGYRRVEDRLRNSFTVSFNPDRRGTNLFSLFIQDEIKLREGLRAIVGSKFEHNDFTGFECQPNLRVAWEPAANHTLWGAISRAVRTPSRSHDDIRINVATVPGRLPLLIAVEGSRVFKSEELLAYELGYRVKPKESVSFDVAAFYNSYKHIITFEPGAPALETDPPPRHLLISSRFRNLMDGETYGVEVAAAWRALRSWRLSAGYTWLNMQLHLNPSSNNNGRDRQVEGSSPEHQFQLRSQIDLPYRLELDAALYYVDRLPSRGIPAYTRLDLRLGWRPYKYLELSIAGQNLLDGRHPEFTSTQVRASEAPRSVFAKVTWRF